MNKKQCIACRNKFIGDKVGDINITYHRFPMNQKRFSLWCNELKLKETDIKPHSYVCSRHFSPRDFRKSAKKIMIAPRAVPSLSYWESCSSVNVPDDKREDNFFKEESCSSVNLPDDNREDISFKEESCSSVNVPDDNEEEISIKEESCSSVNVSDDYREDVSFKEESTIIEKPVITSSVTSGSKYFTDSASESDQSEIHPLQNHEVSKSSSETISISSSATLTASESNDESWNGQDMNKKCKQFEENIPPKKKKKIYRNIRYFGDIQPEHFENPTHLKQFLLIAKKKITMQKKTIRSLQAKLRRRENKIHSLEALTSHLKQKLTHI